jgi:NH3-dependent NAD+ synthetase
MPVLNPEGLMEERIEAIRAYHKAASIPRAVVLVSGGVDSAVILGLCSWALGAGNVAASFVGLNSSQDSLNRARAVSKVFGVRLIELDLTNTFQDVLGHVIQGVEYSYPAGPWWGGPGLKSPGERAMVEVRKNLDKDPTILGSLRSCLRAPIGDLLNRLFGASIFHGTGNEDEDRVIRFFNKRGDGAVDTNPIEMLSKGEVFQLAQALGVPDCILNARPSPDLWGKGEAHNDEDEIKAFLKLEDIQLPMYSYVDYTTGRYKNVGLIERLHRLLDEVVEANNLWSLDFEYRPAVEQVLFQDDPLTDQWRDILVRTARPFFADQSYDYATILKILEAFRRAERITRHKKNDNIPTLGTRRALVERGLLTDKLPNLDGVQHENVSSDEERSEA